MTDLVRLADKLVRAFRHVLGPALQLESLRRLNTGASAHTCQFELVAGGERTACIVQLQSDAEPFISALPKRAQAALQAAAFRAGVATPEVLLELDADDDSPAGFVTRYVAGESLGKRIVHDARFSAARSRLVEQCARELARIHTLPACELDFLPVRDGRAQLHELTARHRSYGARPVFEAAAQWLHARSPHNIARKVAVVHGDFRVGNLLVAEHGLSAVLDWELAHLGDPLEDLGWLCVRSWRFGRADLPAGGFATREALFDAYSAASGCAVDREAVRYWQMLGTLKWGVICQWFAARRLAGATTGIEPAVIGRRVSEVELQLLDLLEGVD
jgi:aminoglycoside phosphotransferase (APT) family kinase protein